MPKAGLAKSGSLYGVHPGVAMVQKWLVELKENTERSMEEWIALVNKEGPKDEKFRRDWLKTKHKVAPNSAWWIAERAEGKGGDEDSPDVYLKAAVRYVKAQYAGPKKKVRPIFDELLTLGKSLGKDVKACPCKTIVPLYRNHVFAQIKPTTRTRIDMGFALKDAPATGRLIDTGGFAKKDRITHRIPISKLSDIDAEVVACLHRAYDLDA